MEFLQTIVINNWQRKLVSLLLAVSIWLMVNHSQTTTKTIENVAVRLINIPAGMTVEGLQSSGMLAKRIPIYIHGNKSILKDITANDVEVVLDATDKSEEWLATINRNNLVSLNPELDILKAVKRVQVQRLPISLTRLITEKIPVMVTHPIGESPRDYQFLDIWPYCLSITVSGPEETIKQIKAKGINLTFNLNDITRQDLESLEYSSSDEVSFLIPEEWKQVSLPTLSEKPIPIDDVLAQELRIDFVKSDLYPLPHEIPISLYFPADHSREINPENLSIALGGIVDRARGLSWIKEPLFAKGVSRFFIDIVQDMIEISVIVQSENKLEWSIQFQNHKILEDRYVATHLSNEEHRHEDPSFAKQRQEYLRNRFRNYMNRFQLYKSQNEKLELSIELANNQIAISDISHEKLIPCHH